MKVNSLGQYSIFTPFASGMTKYLPWQGDDVTTG
jgi:hypothetical protein